MKSLSISNIEITPDNSRKIERLCYHYGMMAFVHGKEHLIADNSITWLTNFERDSELGFEGAKDATAEIMKLFINESLSKRLPVWLRPKIGSFLMALQNLMEDLSHDETVMQAVRVERIDQEGINYDILENQLSHYSKAYEKAITHQSDNNKMDWKQFNEERINEIEKQLKDKERTSLAAA